MNPFRAHIQIIWSADVRTARRQSTIQLGVSGMCVAARDGAYVTPDTGQSDAAQHSVATPAKMNHLRVVHLFQSNHHRLHQAKVFRSS